MRKPEGCAQPKAPPLFSILRSTTSAFHIFSYLWTNCCLPSRDSQPRKDGSNPSERPKPQRTLELFWQIIKPSSWIGAIQPPRFAGLCQTPAEAKNHVTAIATRMKETCLPNTQLNASCHAAREPVSLNFLKHGGKRLTRAAFTGATNVLPLVDSQHVSL